jgi:branched-subunit amino acid transport protein
MELDWRNPQLIASIAAVMVAAGVRRQLVTIGVGLAIFFVWQLCVVA